jgi:KUP system potassium uptake protein
MIIHVVFSTESFYTESLGFAFLVQLAFTCLVCPALILAYMGQVAYLSKNQDFYSSSQVGSYIAVPVNFYYRCLLKLCLYIQPSFYIIEKKSKPLYFRDQSEECFIFDLHMFKFKKSTLIILPAVVGFLSSVV